MKRRIEIEPEPIGLVLGRAVKGYPTAEEFWELFVLKVWTPKVVAEAFRRPTPAQYRSLRERILGPDDPAYSEVESFFTIGAPPAGEEPAPDKLDGSAAKGGIRIAAPLRRVAARASQEVEIAPGATEKVTTAAGDTAMMRPLKILVPLIKDEIDAGEEAGLEHYRAAGEMLLEAKAQLNHGEWTRWFGKHGFAWGMSQANRYMKLASRSVNHAPARNLSEALGDARGSHEARFAPWVQPVHDVVERVNTAGLAQEAKAKAAEEKLVRDLGLQMIDIGFKVLAAKLHPDKPDGSAEAMGRLNQARKIAKGAF